MAQPNEGTPIIEEHRCTSARELLEKLRPGLMHWYEGRSIFRGQGQDWPLLPSAHRYERWKDFLGWFQAIRVFPRPGVDPGYVLDDFAEESLIRRFHESVDNSGLAVPLHNIPFENLDGRRTFARFHQPERIPLIALAQHHGLPTRLLDWTRRPQVAAYFAARQAIESHNEGPMVVWALQTIFFEDEAIGSSSLNAYLELVTAPRASNPNLHAQAGLFTLLHQISEVRTLDEFLEQWAKSSAVAEDYVPLMYKFTLPKTEARRVLVRLSYEGITASALFPGYDGVARELREKALLGEDLLVTDGDSHEN